MVFLFSFGCHVIDHLSVRAGYGGGGMETKKGKEGSLANEALRRGWANFLGGKLFLCSPRLSH